MSEQRDKKGYKGPREVRFFRPCFVMQADPSGLSVVVRAETPAVRRERPAVEGVPA